ncbi:MAG: hypothetical protein LOD91_04265 [Limnochordales bacterium]
MVAERTTQRTVTGQGRPVLYYNVWRFDCPQGCATTTFDFSEASLDPQGMFRPQRLAAETGSGGELVVAPPSLLDRLDLSYLITVVGLILGYAMFAWALIVIDASPVGKIISAALLTLGAFYVVIHMTAAPRQPAAATVPSAVEDPAAGGGETAGAGPAQGEEQAAD